MSNSDSELDEAEKDELYLKAYTGTLEHNDILSSHVSSVGGGTVSPGVGLVGFSKPSTLQTVTKTDQLDEGSNIRGPSRYFPVENSGPICYYCQKSGHIAKNCDRKYNNNSKSCHTCGRNDHLMRDCPEKRSSLRYSQNKDRPSPRYSQNEDRPSPRFESQRIPEDSRIPDDPPSPIIENPRIEKRHRSKDNDKDKDRKHKEKEKEKEKDKDKKKKKKKKKRKKANIEEEEEVEEGELPNQSCFNCGQRGHCGKGCPYSDVDSDVTYQMRTQSKLKIYIQEGDRVAIQKQKIQTQKSLPALFRLMNS